MGFFGVLNDIFNADSDFESAENEEDYLDSLKQADSYHFTIPFEYINGHREDGSCDIGITDMEIDVIWNDSENGYQINHYVPNMYLIDPAEGNGDEESFYENYVRDLVIENLRTLGIPEIALVWP